MHLENYPFFFFLFSRQRKQHPCQCTVANVAQPLTWLALALHARRATDAGVPCVILIPNRLMRSHVGSNARQTPLRELKSHGWFGLKRGARAKSDIQAYFATSESIKHEQHGLIWTDGTSENTVVVTRQQNGRQNLCSAVLGFVHPTGHTWNSAQASDIQRSRYGPGIYFHCWLLIFT